MAVGALPVLGTAAVVELVGVGFVFPPLNSAKPSLNSAVPLAATFVLRSPDAEVGTVPSRPTMRSPALSAKELMFPLFKIREYVNRQDSYIRDEYSQ